VVYLALVGRHRRYSTGRLEGKHILEARLEIRGDAEQTLRELFRDLLAKSVCEALLLPMKLPSGQGVAPTMMRDAALLGNAAPFAPVLPLSEATVASHLTRGHTERPLGIVLHPCQIRAYIELVKLQQATRDNVLVIGLDCPGTYQVAQYTALARTTGNPGLDLLTGLRAGRPAPHPGYAFREACQTCQQPLPEQADLRVRIVGIEADNELRLQGSEELFRRLELTPATPLDADNQAERQLARARLEARQQMMAEFQHQVHDVMALLEQFSTCVHCLNCMGACPLCYCRECIFRTETFDHRPADYERWAERKGAVRLPADTLLFHLTRLNHMVASCVGCGLCESACPNGLPVARLFQAVGQKVQGIFDYMPGRDQTEEMPISTFRENELGQV
jgi:formate dehydrogenase subunit beta